MPVTLLAGPESSTDNTDNNVRDMHGVFELEPNQAPLVRLMDALGGEPAINPKVEWEEDEAMPRFTALSASATSAATALGVSADIFRVGDVVRIPVTGEAIEVTATAAGAITATRGLGRIVSSANTSAAASSELFIVANANVEGNTLREIKYPQLVTASNYCEIVRTPLGLTGTETATKHYGGDEEDRLIKKFGIEHARSWEQIAFFGVRHLNSTNKRFAGGLFELCTTNVTVVGGALTEADFQSFLRSGFRYGNEEKWLFASPLACAAIEGFARSNLRVVDTVGEKYGIRMKQYVSGQGIVNLVMERWLNDSGAATAGYRGWAFLVDLDKIKKRTLRPTKLKMNVQAPDYDGVKHEYITEASFEIQHERNFARMTGITG
jgi:hypothetical protein